MAKRVVLCGKRIAVLIPKPEEKSKGGILVPDAAKERKAEGTVVMVGEGSLGSFPVEVGDVVTFLPFGVVEMTVDGQELSIVDEADVVSVTHIV